MSKVIVIDEDTFFAKVRELMDGLLAPLAAKVAAIERPDEMIGLEEAMRVTKLAKTQIYQYVHDGIINHYGEGRKPVFSRKECETARQRKHQKRANSLR